MYVITIDCGTTNLRIHLINGDTNDIIDVVKKNVGVRNTSIDGTPERLKTELARGLAEIMEVNRCKPSDILYIAASGMITSNLGLFEVPHIPSPSALEDFANAAVVKIFPEFYQIPCVLVPGMKNAVPSLKGNSYESIDLYDVMRGEEVETFGLIKQMQLKGKGLMILPGSHTKYVFVEDGTIRSCLSTLCGEMLYAVQKDTILSSSLSSSLVEKVDKESLLAGYRSSTRYGLTRSLYQVRLLQLFDYMNNNERANYYLGCVIASDIQAMQFVYRDVEFDWIVVGGSNPMRLSFTHILEELKVPNVIEATDEQVQMSTILGAMEISSLCLAKDPTKI